MQQDFFCGFFCVFLILPYVKLSKGSTVLPMPFMIIKKLFTVAFNISIIGYNDWLHVTHGPQEGAE